MATPPSAVTAEAIDPGRDPPLRRALTFLLGGLLLCWPALLNRYPLLYADSVGYLEDGRPVAAALFLHRTGVWAMRSEFYSLGIFPLHWNVTPCPIVAMQGVLTAYVVWLVFRSILPRSSGRQFLIFTALLSLLTSVSWFVSLIMPDILGALLYLAIYLMVLAGETLSRRQRWILGLIAFWSITSHATHLMLAAGLCLLLAALLLSRWPPMAGRGRPLVILAMLVALSAAAQISLHAYLYGRPSLSGNHPPYLMARIIADGPGDAYLKQHCASLDWAICAHVDSLPDNDDEFLWGDGGVWSSADAKTQQRLLDEEMPLVLATLRAYPRQQIAKSFSNFTRQFDDFGVNDFDNNAWMEDALEGALPGSHAHYLRTLQRHDAVPSNFFTILQRSIVLPSALLLVTLTPYLVRRRRLRLLGLIAVIVPVLFANALVTAVLSSSDSRYQARIIWLVPMLAALVALDAVNHRQPQDADRQDQDREGLARP